MPPRKPFVFLLLLLFFASASSSGDLSFSFSSFTLRNLTLLGDAYLRDGVVGLTRDLEVPSSSSGSFIYNRPISFSDPGSNSTSSFSTRFTFSVTNLNPASSGDGLAFFLSPDNQTLGTSGAYLGLSKPDSNNRFVAVEFDTRLDPHFNDPSDDHVGVDVDGLVSVATADPADQGVFLKSGEPVTAWVEYRSDLKTLDVFVGYSGTKPSKPLISVAGIDLSGHLRGDVFVGFSGATDGSTELHLVSDWSFRTTSGLSPARPRSRSHPHNSSVTQIEPYIPIPSGGSSGEKHHHRLALGLGIAFPGFFCIALIVFGLITMRKWKFVKSEKSFKSELLAGRPREFSYRDLRLATRGFHSSRILGHGAFGTVYKACFNSSGAIAAVKRSKHSNEGKTEFLGELSIIACLRHKNLLQLQGWCMEKNELLLVYEFMPYGSLDRMLYPESGQGLFLNWPLRYNVAVGMASALAYLHEECEQQVIHRDIKTSNIMLDKNFSARLGDFGLARLMDHDKSPVSTLTAGTMGYLAPEYLQYGKATEKTDAFSYGVVVLEVACGRRPIEREENSQRMVNLVDWVWGLYSQGKIMEAGDGRLGGDFNEDEMRRLLLVGLSCANPDSSQRPSMRRVLQVLNKEAELAAVPKVKPSLMFSCGLPLSLEEIVSDGEV